MHGRIHQGCKGPVPPLLECGGSTPLWIRVDPWLSSVPGPNPNLNLRAPLRFPCPFALKNSASLPVEPCTMPVESLSLIPLCASASQRLCVTFVRFCKSIRVLRGFRALRVESGLFRVNSRISRENYFLPILRVGQFLSYPPCDNFHISRPSGLNAQRGSPDP